MEVSTVSAQKCILEHFDFQALEFWNRDPYPIVIVHRKYTSADMFDTVEFYYDEGRNGCHRAACVHASSDSSCDSCFYVNKNSP